MLNKHLNNSKLYSRLKELQNPLYVLETDTEIKHKIKLEKQFV